MDTQVALNILLSYKKIFDDLNIKFWLDGGTCLGAYRENSFLASDFDIDVGILGGDDIQTPKIIEALKEEGFKNIHLKQHPCEGTQISSIKDGIPTDVFFYYKRDKRRFRVMFDERLGTVRFIPCVYPAYLFECLTRINFMDYIEFNLPCPTEEYLELTYGDWKIDKTPQEFHWQDDYKSMDMDFQLYPNHGKGKWVMTEDLNGDLGNGDFFIPYIKAGYKLYPIVIDKNNWVIDGRKRLEAYLQCHVPMVECYVSTE